MTTEEHRCSRWAHCMDKLRIIPRAIIGVCYSSYLVLTYYAWDWFTAYDFNALENEAVALAIVAFPAAILSALAGVIGGITKAYFNKPGYSPQNGE